jgi:hypothetical protein
MLCLRCRVSSVGSIMFLVTVPYVAWLMVPHTYVCGDPELAYLWVLWYLQ